MLKRQGIYFGKSLLKIKQKRGSLAGLIVPSNSEEYDISLSTIKKGLVAICLVFCGLKSNTLGGDLVDSDLVNFRKVSVVIFAIVA